MQHPKDSKDGNVLTDMVKGAVAGAVGIWALDRVTWWLWDRENPMSLHQERTARRRSC